MQRNEFLNQRRPLRRKLAFKQRAVRHDESRLITAINGPLLQEVQAIVAPLEIGKPDQDYSCLKKLYSRKDIFAVDLYEAGLGERIEGMVKELYAGPGAVRKTLHKYVLAR